MIVPMNKERKESYVEVLEVLNNMDSKYIEKIPKKLIEFFINNRSKEYKFKLDRTIPFEEQKLKENTINILAMLNLNYWCESEEHKKALLKKYYDNEIKYQEKIMEQYDADSLFKRNSKQVSSLNKENINNIPQKYEQPKWYIGILNFIKRIFNRGNIKKEF